MYSVLPGWMPQIGGFPDKVRIHQSLHTKQIKSEDFSNKNLLTNNQVFLGEENPNYHKQKLRISSPKHYKEPAINPDIVHKKYDSNFLFQNIKLYFNYYKFIFIIFKLNYIYL